MDARRAGSRGQSRFRFLREIAGAVRLANPSDEVGTRAYGASGIKSYTIRLLEDARPIMPQFGRQLNLFMASPVKRAHLGRDRILRQILSSLKA